MKSLVDNNKRRLLMAARVVARKLDLPFVEEEDILEDNGVFYIDLDIPNDKKFSHGLTKKIFSMSNKTKEISKLKKDKENKGNNPNK